jgi:ribosome-associated protein
MTATPTWTRADLPDDLNAAIDLAVDKLGRRPVVLRLTEKAGYTDWALLVSGRSERHVQGITDGILDGLGKRGRKPLGTDGLDAHTWDLVDYDDFLVHVFYHPVRTFYDLESMWCDVPRVELELAADVMEVHDLDGLAPPQPMPAFRGNREFGGFQDEFAEDDVADVEGRDLEYDEADDALFERDADDDFDDDDDLGDDDPLPADDGDDDDRLFEK